MKSRIAIWAGIGFLVAAFWALYFLSNRPVTYADPIMTVVDITCPIALLRSRPISLYVVLLANAATYALVGFTLESWRRKLRHSL